MKRDDVCEDDALWIEKVHVLLFLDDQQPNGPTDEPVNYEAQLAGLLLLTRIRNSNEFLRIFNRFVTTPRSIVAQWLHQKHPLIWLEDGDENTLNYSNLQCMFVRLLTQLLHRCLFLRQNDHSFLNPSPTAKEEEPMVHHQMMYAIVNFSFSSSVVVVPDQRDRSFLLFLQLEVLTCLHVYVQHCLSGSTSTDSLEELVEPVWRSLLSLSAADPPPVDSLSMSAQPSAKSEEVLHPNRIMLQTMHALLQQTTYIDADVLTSTENQLPSWVPPKLTLQFLTEYCVLFSSDGRTSSVAHPKRMPKCVPVLLETWKHCRSALSNKKHIPVLPVLLAQFILTSLQLSLVHWRAVVPPIHLHRLLQENGIVFSAVLQLLLASVVATESSQVDGVAVDALRTNAWSCVGYILAGFGSASFLTLTDETSSRWGIARPLCTILRLAVGEYKIQWTLRLDQEEVDEVHRPTAILHPKSFVHLNEVAELGVLSEWTILDACSEVIMATVRFLLQLSDQMDDDVPFGKVIENSEEGGTSINIPPDAILHMHQSIQEVYLVTMQCLLHDGPESRGPYDSPNHIRDVIRLFSVVISEMDVFPISASNVTAFSEQSSRAKNETDAVSMSQQLRAVYVALTHQVICDTYQTDVELHSTVASCVLKVLATAEGYSDLLSLLHESKILGIALVSFIDRSFRCYMHMNHVSSVVELCEVMELSVRLEVHDTVSSSQYQSFIVNFLQHNLSDFGGLKAQSLSGDMVNSLQALVNCYITLQREAADIPVSHAFILKLALELGS